MAGPYCPCDSLKLTKLNKVWLQRFCRYWEMRQFRFKGSADLTREKTWELQTNMAASTTWRKVLNEHSIFDVLRQTNGDLKSPKECRSWIEVCDGELYLLNAYNSSILTTNLKCLGQKCQPDRVPYQVGVFIFPFLGLSAFLATISTYTYSSLWISDHNSGLRASLLIKLRMIQADAACNVLIG